MAGFTHLCQTHGEKSLHIHPLNSSSIVFNHVKDSVMAHQVFVEYLLGVKKICYMLVTEYTDRIRYSIYHVSIQ